MKIIRNYNHMHSRKSLYKGKCDIHVNALSLQKIPLGHVMLFILYTDLNNAKYRYTKYASWRND